MTVDCGQCRGSRSHCRPRRMLPERTSATAGTGICERFQKQVVAKEKNRTERDRVIEGENEIRRYEKTTSTTADGHAREHRGTIGVLTDRQATAVARSSNRSSPSRVSCGSCTFLLFFLRRTIALLARSPNTRRPPLEMQTLVLRQRVQKNNRRCYQQKCTKLPCPSTRHGSQSGTGTIFFPPPAWVRYKFRNGLQQQYFFMLC